MQLFTQVSQSPACALFASPKQASAMPASPTPNFFSAARRVADWARLLVSSSNLLFMTCPLVVVLKCRRLAQMTTVKLGALDRRGAYKMRRPADEDVCAR